MENQELHAQKVTILSRLIKESSLTLEEALLLLKDEQEEAIINQAPPMTSTGSWSTYAPNYITTGTTTMPLGATISFTNTIADDSADLNN
jgi:uncharacterized membrane protein